MDCFDAVNSKMILKNEISHCNVKLFRENLCD